MARIALQYTGLYCRLGGLAGLVYRNTLDCIVTEAVRLWGRFVLQYKLYCDVQEQEARLPVSQSRQLCRDKAQGRAGRSGRTGQERWLAGRQARWATGARGAAGARGGRAGARVARGTSVGRGLGMLLGCGLCTWCTQPVFDLV